jgi:hypothetical protein
MSKVKQENSFPSASDVNDVVKIPSDQVSLDITRANGDSVPKEMKGQKKDEDNKEETNSTSSNVDVGVDIAVDVNSGKVTLANDASGEKLTPGDIVLVFSDEMSSTKSIEDYFNDVIQDLKDDKSFEKEDDEKKDNDDSADDEDAEIDIPKLLNSFMPAGMETAIIVMVDEDSIVASSVTLDKHKYAFIDKGIIHTIPKNMSYRISKLDEHASYADAMMKLYSDILMYNAIKDTQMLDHMITQ